MNGNIYISGIIDNQSDINYSLGRNKIEPLLDSRFDIEQYSSKIKKLGLIYKAFAENGVIPATQDDKKYKRKDQILVLYLPLDYIRFCSADHHTALQMMAEQTLRSVNKLLSPLKYFAGEKFYTDLYNFFTEEGWLEHKTIKN